MGCNLKDLASPESIELSDLAGQRVAVDTFLVAYQFITSLRARGEMEKMDSTCGMLRVNQLHICLDSLNELQR